jgi:hypothetical protein
VIARWVVLVAACLASVALPASLRSEDLATDACGVSVQPDLVYG